MITRRFTRRYILALALVAGLTIVGQVLVQRQLQNQTGDSYLVNYAGQQRYQSQQIAKDALLLTYPGRMLPKRTVQNDLRRVLSRWERYHVELKTGRLTDLATTIPNSAPIRALFDQLEPDFRAISQATHELLGETARSVPSLEAEYRNVQKILSHNMLFLTTMDAIVRQYEREAEAKVQRLHEIEQMLMVITLFVLLLEALFIFHPAVQMLRETVRQLTNSEYQTRLINEDLQQSHLSLKQAQTQLMREAIFGISSGSMNSVSGCRRWLRVRKKSANGFRANSTTVLVKC